MWLAFAVDEEAAVYFMGVISGPEAYSMALWMRNEIVEEDSITLYDVPVIVFSGHEADTFGFQNGSWLRANLVLNKSIKQKWVWSDTATMMPELVVETVRSFRLKVNLSIIYSCKRLLTGGVPLPRRRVQPASSQIHYPPSSHGQHRAREPASQAQRRPKC